MLKSYVTIAIRHWTRHKGYTAINVLGLAVGMVCAMLIFLYVRFELSYDRYHEKADRIYRVAVNNDARTPPPVGPALQEDFSEVLSFVRLLPTTGTWLMKHEEKIYYENRVYWADNALLDTLHLSAYPRRFPNGPGSALLCSDQRRYRPEILR